MEDKDYFILIGSVFIKGNIKYKELNEENNDPSSLNKLSIFLASQDFFKNNIKGNRRLIDHYNYFCLGKTHNKKKTTVSDTFFKAYISFLKGKTYNNTKDATKAFFNGNEPSKEYIEKNLPFKKNTKKESQTNKEKTSSNNYYINTTLNINKLNNHKEKKTKKKKLVKLLKEYYLKHPNFNSIPIHGDMDNNLGILSMENYFIQVSYISQHDIYDKESAIKLEKENSKQKVLLHTDLSQAYLNEVIFYEYNKIIISGNPGVGKSIFARWICYQWAKQFSDNEKSKVFIYIQLRDLDLSSKTLLFDYVKQIYFDNNVSPITSLNLLLKKIGNYQIVLDGFDEIPSEFQKTIIELIKPLNYIILSRPYGLIGHFFNSDISYQIDGFNSSCIKQYVTSLINIKSPKEKSSNQFISILKNNKVLMSYSHTPLMLSYMLVIYLTHENSEKELSRIESIYDLQDKIFSNFILDYAIKKRELSTEEYLNLEKDIYSFAYKMLLKKQFMYSGEYIDSYNKITTYMSEIGLGSKRSILKPDGKKKWQFSFSTVTFQEYFAAKYFINLPIKAESIVYFTQYPFFWNFVIMLLGALSINPSFLSLIKKTLSLIHKKTDENNRYNKYIYYMLLSECNTSTLKNILDKEDISKSLLFYENTFFDNFWRDTNYNSIEKLFYKSSVKLQDYYVTNIINQIKNFIFIEDEHIIGKDLSYLLKLIEIGLIKEHSKTGLAILNEIDQLKVQDDILFYKIVDLEDLLNQKEDNLEILLKQQEDNLETLLKLQEDIIKLKNRLGVLHQKFSRNNISSRLLYLIIEDLPRKININYQEKIYNTLENENLYELCNPINTPNSIFLTIIEKKKFKEEISLLNKKYKNEHEKINLEPKAGFDIIYSIIENLFLYIITKDNSLEIDPFFIRNQILLAEDYIDTIEENEYYGEISIIKIQTIKNLIIACYVKLNDARFYNDLFEFIINYKCVTYFTIIDNAKFTNYLSNTFKEVLNQDYIEGVSSLITMLECTKYTNTQFNFYLLKNSLFELFYSLLITFQDNLDANDFDEILDEEIKEILKKIIKLYTTPFDQKIFFDKLIENNLITIPFVYNEAISKKLANGLIFYERKYWEEFEKYFEKHHYKLEYVLPLLKNKNLLLFSSNHIKLLKLLSLTLENKKNITEEVLTRKTIHEIFYAISIALQNYHNYQNDKNLLLPINEFLNLPKVHSENILNGYNPELDATIIPDIDETIVDVTCSYLLNYYFLSSNNNFLFKIDLDVIFINNAGTLNLIVEILIKLSNNLNYDFDIHKLKKPFGNTVFDKITQLIKDRSSNQKPFNPDYLKQKLMLL